MINVTNQGGGTMVWKLNAEKAAIVADIETKGNGGFLVRFRGETTFFFTKKDALHFAKKWVKEAI
jgi:hypothetical protein